MLAGVRWYSPQLRRWLSRDPIRYSGGDNLYEYVDQNPVTFLDPEGLDAIDSIASIAAGFGDGISSGGSAILRDVVSEAIFGQPSSVDLASPSYIGSNIAGSVWGGLTCTALGARALASIGGSRLGHILNHNRRLRFGPGRMPSRGALPGGTHVPRVSIGARSGGIHIDLRIRPFD